MWGFCFWTSSQHLTPSSSRNWCPSWLNWETPLQHVTGSWVSWLGGHSVWGSTTKHPPASSWTPACPRDVCPLLADDLWLQRHENNNQTTMEMVLNFGRAGPTNPSFLYVNRAAVEIIPSFQYLGVHLSYTLTWCTNSTAVFKKAHQLFYLVRKLRRAQLNRAFYSCAVEIALMSCFTVVWRLHGGREDGSAAGGKVCSEDRRV